MVSLGNGTDKETDKRGTRKGDKERLLFTGLCRFVGLIFTGLNVSPWVMSSTDMTTATERRFSPDLSNTVAVLLAFICVFSWLARRK